MKLLLCLFLSLNAWANLHQAPPSFFVAAKKAIFVDFTSARYQLTYNNRTKKAEAVTTIHFVAKEKGFPLFDSVAAVKSALLDGKEVNIDIINTPDKASKLRLVQKSISPGKHTLRIKTPINLGTKYHGKKRGVSSGFFIKDLTDRMFLERYLPTNYEFDQYQMTFKVKILNSKKKHNIFANGKVVKFSKNFFEITYPKYYTSSSIFFHLVPLRKFKRLRFSYNSINGRKVPVVIYSRFKIRNRLFAKKTIKVLKELEKDYGAWPHSKLTIYGTKLKGGMEYPGATATSYRSLGHELQHSYFAKGILPADGNSGWMDEAIASWRDKGHQKHKNVDYYSFNLANHSVYTRKTDSHSYKKGRSFIAHLDYEMRRKTKTNMKSFLKFYFEKRKFTTVQTKDFISDLKTFTGLDFQAKFDRYIFGKKENKRSRSPAVEPPNPHHPIWSDKEIQSIL